MIAFTSSSIFPYQPGHFFMKCKDVTWLKTQRKQTTMEASFKIISENSKSCNVKFYIRIYNKSHGITQIEMGSLKVSLKYIPKMNSLTTEYQHLINPNHCYSPVSYYLNMKAQFYMLIDYDFSKQAHA